MPTIINQKQGEEQASVPGSRAAVPEASALLLSASKPDYSFKVVIISLQKIKAISRGSPAVYRDLDLSTVNSRGGSTCLRTSLDSSYVRWAIPQCKFSIL